jgi:hypothetical protein
MRILGWLLNKQSNPLRPFLPLRIRPFVLRSDRITRLVKVFDVRESRSEMDGDGLR